MLSWVKSHMDTKNFVEMGFPHEHIIVSVWEDEISVKARSKIVDSNGGCEEHGKLVQRARGQLGRDVACINRVSKGCFADLQALGHDPGMALEGHSFGLWHGRGYLCGA